MMISSSEVAQQSLVLCPADACSGSISRHRVRHFSEHARWTTMVVRSGIAVE
jgi:hypothetical protein